MALKERGDAVLVLGLEDGACDIDDASALLNETQRAFERLLLIRDPLFERAGADAPFGVGIAAPGAGAVQGASISTRSQRPLRSASASASPFGARTSGNWLACLADCDLTFYRDAVAGGRNQQIMDRKDRFAGLAILLAALLMATAEAGARANQVNLGSQAAEREFREAVEIGNDSGGYVAEYALRLYEMREARQKVRFVGVCDSACTLFLALPAEQTCITEGVYFRFHAPSAPSASAATAVAAYMMRKYPQWVRVWIDAQGGLTDRLTTMGYLYAQKFMRTCTSAQR